MTVISRLKHVKLQENASKFNVLGLLCEAHLNDIEKGSLLRTLFQNILVKSIAKSLTWIDQLFWQAITIICFSSRLSCSKVIKRFFSFFVFFSLLACFRNFRMQMKFHSPCYKYAGKIICKATRWKHSHTPQDEADCRSRFVGWNFACSVSRSGDILLYS